MPEIRSAACVGGAIKLVSMVGYLEGWHFHRYRLTTWTLSPDLREWRQDGVFPLEDLWMTDEYRALDLPQRMPICPVLSPREDAVVYVVVNDVVHDQLRAREGYSKVRLTEVDFRGQYVFGLDMHHNKIISTSCHRPDRMMEIMPRLIAADFCASLLGATDHKDIYLDLVQVSLILVVFVPHFKL
ncbi:hypothetical protein HU200_060130 [Digitaria exilis]|uniref:DUF1618 domain-containing protein n=1 Tax=Digitaria exilis TaxID=1010633 RepID=A0A835DXQ8_9POAL|nr:hypothetical protein HU200_060130 [Digitaria exilis]